MLYTITDHLAAYATRPRDARHGYCVYPVSKMAFVLIYDFEAVSSPQAADRCRLKALTLFGGKP